MTVPSFRHSLFFIQLLRPMTCITALTSRRQLGWLRAHRLFPFFPTAIGRSGGKEANTRLWLLFLCLPGNITSITASFLPLPLTSATPHKQSQKKPDDGIANRKSHIALLCPPPHLAAMDLATTMTKVDATSDITVQRCTQAARATESYSPPYASHAHHEIATGAPCCAPRCSHSMNSTGTYCAVSVPAAHPSASQGGNAPDPSLTRLTVLAIRFTAAECLRIHKSTIQQQWDKESHETSPAPLSAPRPTP